jgi:hypothetical protein
MRTIIGGSRTPLNSSTTTRGVRRSNENSRKKVQNDVITTSTPTTESARARQGPRRIVTAALHRPHVAAELRVYVEPESANDLPHSQVERFDVRVLKKRATVLRRILLEKDGEMRPDDPARECHCHQGWICEAHPDQPWPHDDQTAPEGTCPGAGMQCDDPGCPWWQGSSPATLDTSDWVVFSSTRDQRTPEE